MIDIIPYRTDKDLGRAYNDIFRPDNGDAVCFRDGDTLFLTPDYGNILDEYHRLYPDDVLTCFTNRVSTLSKMQLLTGKPDDNPDITYHIKLAEEQKKELYKVTEINRDISGTLMIIPLKVLSRFPFKEGGQALGVDTEWNRRIRKAGIKILRCDGLYIFHIYRLTNGIGYKKHLL